MENLRDLDVRSRGLSSLIDLWKVDHDALLPVWQSEDLIAQFLQCHAQSQQLFQHYCDLGSFPRQEARFSYFSEILVALLTAGRDIEQAMAPHEAEHQIKGAENLRAGIASLAAILDEDRWPTEATLQAGLLDDWN